MEKIVRKTLTDQIFDYIQDQIANGNWKRGEKLPSETELAEKLGVSRMSLRAAIQRSNTMGLTETKVGEGTFVKKISMRPFIENLLKSNLLSADNDDINDMRKAAEFRGGKCLSDSMTKGDLRSPITWSCQFGHEFKASPTLVLLGGHWCPECFPMPWNYDEIARGNPFFAQVWYPLHDKDEDNYYDESIFKGFKDM